MNRHMCYQPCLSTSIPAPSVAYFIYVEKSDMRYRKVRDLYGLIDCISLIRIYVQLVALFTRRLSKHYGTPHFH